MGKNLGRSLGSFQLGLMHSQHMIFSLQRIVCLSHRTVVLLDKLAIHDIRGSVDVKVFVVQHRPLYQYLRQREIFLVTLRIAVLAGY